VIEKKKDI